MTQIWMKTTYILKKRRCLDKYISITESEKMWKLILTSTLADSKHVGLDYNTRNLRMNTKI